MAGLLAYPGSFAPSQFSEESVVFGDGFARSKASGNYSSGYCRGISPRSLLMLWRRLFGSNQFQRKVKSYF